MQKKQLEYLEGSQYCSGSGGAKLGIDRFIWGGMSGEGTMNFKFIGGGGAMLASAAHPTPVPTPMFYWSLAQTNAIFTCALSFLCLRRSMC